MAIKLGQQVKDKITGFEGTVTAIAKYLSGCTRAEVCSNNDPAKEYWFDIDRLGELEAPPGWHNRIPPPSINPS